MRKQIFRLAAGVAVALFAAASAGAQERVVNVYNWSDYIDSSILDDFTKFITPLRTLGKLDYHDLGEKRLKPGSRLRIHSVWEEDDAEVFLPQVQLAARLNEAGDMGKAWLSYPGIPESLRKSLSYWLIVQTPVTLRYDADETRRVKTSARDAVDDIYDSYSQGDQLVEPEEPIDEAKLHLLQAEYDANEEAVGVPERLIRLAVVFLMLVVLAVLKGYYIVTYEPPLARSLGKITVYLVVLVIAVAIGRSLSFWSRAEIIPLAVTVMVFAIAFNQVLATLTGFTLALILTLCTTMRLDQFVVLMSTAGMAALPLARVASRSKPVKVGFYAGATYLLTSLGVNIIESQNLSDVFSNQIWLQQALYGAGFCVATGFFIVGSLPFIESVFGVVTDISLLELSDPSHPLLQELVRRAPGTYNHSIAVASVAEAAAEAIGANGLLVRVGAYFHDIGKMLKPNYFIENVQAGTESRHNQLAPAMSTLIIIGHVKDGVDLALQHHLPKALINFIEQHHGTTLVEYFYRAAARQAEQDPDHGQDAPESAFRYPGPKPQTPEAGVLMLADCVESASRIDRPPPSPEGATMS